MVEIVAITTSKGVGTATTSNSVVAGTTSKDITTSAAVIVEAWCYQQQ